MPPDRLPATPRDLACTEIVTIALASTACAGPQLPASPDCLTPGWGIHHRGKLIASRFIDMPHGELRGRV
jgi:hypothetical protein